MKSYKNRLNGITPKHMIVDEPFYKKLGITCWIRDAITWFKRVVLRQSKVSVPKHCVGCKGPKHCKAFK